MSGRWEYLDSEPFRLRYAIAADLLAYHCAELLEIGAVGRGIAAQGGPMNFVDITLVGPGVDIGFGVETGYDVPFQNVEREWLDPAPEGPSEQLIRNAGFRARTVLDVFAHAPKWVPG